MSPNSTFIRFGEQQVFKHFRFIYLHNIPFSKKFNNQDAKVFGLAYTKAVAQKHSVKKTLSKISQNSQEIICVGISFLIKLLTQALQDF